MNSHPIERKYTTDSESLLLLYYVLLYIIYGTAVRNATDDVVEDGGKKTAPQPYDTPSTCT